MNTAILLFGQLSSILIGCTGLFFLLRRDQSRLESVSEFVLLMLTLVTIPVFTLCLLTRSYVSLHWTSSVDTALFLVLGLLAWWRGGATSKKEPLAHPGENRALYAAGLVFLTFMFNYDREHFQYACINSVVMQAVTPEAAGAYDPHEGRDDQIGQVENTNHTDFGEPEKRDATRGMSLIDVHGTGQRLGTTAVIAPYVARFGSLGFRLVYALLALLCFLFAYRIARTLTGSENMALIAALLSVLNPYVLKVIILDENFMAMAFLMATVAFLLEEKSVVYAGIAFGAALGIRHVDILFLPAALFWLYKRPRDLGMFLAAGLVFALPCAIHHKATYGSFFTHEHFVDEVFLGVPHTIFGFEFNYTGLLNYPFTDEWIRTPYNPFPTSLYYPLNVLAHLGSILCGFMLLGAIGICRHEKRIRRFLAIWLIPQFTLYAMLENWMDPNKMGVILTLFPALTILLSYAMKYLFPTSTRFTAAQPVKRRWVTLIACIAGLSTVAVACNHIQPSDDKRFYSKYPKVRAERAEYYEYERSVVTSGNLFPSAALAQQYSKMDIGRRMSGLASYIAIPAKQSPNESPAVDITIDFSTPLVGRSNYLKAGGNGAALDLTEVGTQLEISGLKGWEPTPLKVRAVRDSTRDISVFFSFGDADFADFSSDKNYTIEAKQRPRLATKKRSGSLLSLRIRRGDRIRLYETVSLNYEVLVYTWDAHIGDGGIDITPARKLFHN